MAAKPEGTASDESDLVGRAMAALESAVGLIRDHSTRPVLFAARLLVAGVAVAFLAIVVGVATTIGLVRLLTVDVFGGRVWASDLLLGGIFAIGGALVFARGRRGDGSDAGG